MTEWESIIDMQSAETNITFVSFVLLAAVLAYYIIKTETGFSFSSLLLTKLWHDFV